MASYEFELGEIPEDKRERELWLQHAAGLIYFEDARQYAIDQIDSNMDASAKEKVIEGINNTVYGIMMIIDGVSGRLGLGGSEYEVSLETRVNLFRKSDDEFELIDHVDLAEGDGMCMGYHGWLEGDFGDVPVAKKKDIA